MDTPAQNAQQPVQTPVGANPPVPNPVQQDINSTQINQPITQENDQTSQKIPSSQHQDLGSAENTALTAQNSSSPAQTPPVTPPAAPQTPISLPNKELGPSRIAVSTASVELRPRPEEDEDVSSVGVTPVPSEALPELHPEVKEAGVEVSIEHHEKPHLTDEHKAVGIEHAPVNAPVSTQPTLNIVLPLPEQKAQEVARKDKNISDSILWLAFLVLKRLRVLREVKQEQTQIQL